MQAEFVAGCVEAPDAGGGIGDEGLEGFARVRIAGAGGGEDGGVEIALEEGIAGGGVEQMGVSGDGSDEDGGGPAGQGEGGGVRAARGERVCLGKGVLIWGGGAGWKGGAPEGFARGGGEREDFVRGGDEDELRGGCGGGGSGGKQQRPRDAFGHRGGPPLGVVGGEAGNDSGGCYEEDVVFVGGDGQRLVGGGRGVAEDCVAGNGLDGDEAVESVGRGGGGAE